MQHQTSLLRSAPDTEAIKQIQYFEGLALEHDERGYCVCTSDGKDSRVLGHLFRRAGVKHFYLTSITGIDPPELVYFRRKNFQEYRDLGYLTYEIMYTKSIWQMMRKKLMPPMRNIRYCCEVLKETRYVEQCNALISLGVRKFESVGRMNKRNELEIVQPKKNIILPFDNDDNRKTFENCYKDNEKRLNPIAYWTDEDIWNYSEAEHLEQCSLYQEGFHRLGCIGCPMARSAGRKQAFARWPGFERLWKKSFDDMYAIRVAQGKNVSQASGAEWFDDWLNDRYTPEQDDMQMNLFESE